MRKLITILTVLTILSTSVFAKSFEYKTNNEEWSYDEESRMLDYESELSGAKYYIHTYDVSEEEAWKIIKGEEFPTFTFLELGIDRYEIPARDYSKMVK